jgi:N-acetylmuramic acid 6-phosphate etherase
MPPTFGVPPDRVQVIIAGGAPAIQASVEGAEDDDMAGVLAIQERGVTKGDAVCGITASGRTPFVRGALQAAKTVGAATILLTCNPNREKGYIRADVELDIPTGPELITGSTRLKAGTATKVALNILSSCTMIRLGRVEGNLMACLQPTNKKLRDRATRIVAARLALSESEARSRLQCANWDIRSALVVRRENGQESSIR